MGSRPITLAVVGPNPPNTVGLLPEVGGEVGILSFSERALGVKEVVRNLGQ